MKRPFELDWMGGVAERHVRRRRPGVDDLPWGTLDPKDYPPVLVDRARISWTEGALNEYCSAAAFSELVRAMLACAAPVDLTGMASEFAGDEMLHVELNCRVAMELGGGVPALVDFAALTPKVSRRTRPLLRALEIGVRLCCVGEAFSVPMLTGSMRAASHPLTRAVLERIAQDEVPHARVGWLLLDWAADRIDDRDRDHLARAAERALAEIAPFWALSSEARAGRTTEGFLVEHVNALGWMESSEYREAARLALRDEIVAPLRAHGIDVALPQN